MSTTQTLPNNPAREALRPLRERIAELQDAFAVRASADLLAVIDAEHARYHEALAALSIGRAA